MPMRRCSICGSRKFEDLISFGKQPLCAHLYRTADQEDVFHDGRYVYCTSCRFVQIGTPVSLELQYESYEYFSSGLFPPYVRELARKVSAFAAERGSGLVVEIGSNDGGFLNLVREQGSYTVLGVEASRVLASYASSRGITSLNEYFGQDTVEKILKGHGHPKVVVARFVLEHIVDLDDFLANIRALCEESTIVLFEVPDIDYILEYNVYTGFWDQHVNYFNLYTLDVLCVRYGLKIFGYTRDNSRAEQVILAWLRPTERAQAKRYSHTPLARLESFSRRVPELLGRLRGLCRCLHDDGKRIATYGASHYPTNVVNYAKIGGFLDYAVDKDERKWGKFLPGSRLKVVPPPVLDEDRPDFCVIAAVGNEKRIMAQHPDFLRKGGRFICANPPEIIAAKEE